MEQPDDDGGVAENMCSYCGSTTCPAALDVNQSCPEEEADMLDEEDDLEEDDFDGDDEVDEFDGGPDNPKDEAL